MSQIKKLTFVYNADSGLFSQLSDFAHKLISPQTYQCNLCKLTYGGVGMKKEWEECLAKLPYQKEFLHKDEFIKHYPSFSQVALPAIFLIFQNQPNFLVSAAEINEAKTLTELKLLLIGKLSKSTEMPGLN